VAAAHHGLISDVITALDGTVDHIQITDLREGIFVAELVLDGGVRVSGRPSDSVALASRGDAPIHVDEPVLEAAGVVVEETTFDEDELARFRAFLDSVSAEGFGGGQVM
jgi:uncharacterized protein